MAKFCPTCGKPLQYENTEICPHCGVRVTPPVSGKSTRSTGEKIVIIIAVIAVVFIGFIIFSAVIAAFVFGMAGSVEKVKVIAATAHQSGNNILVTWQGGTDNAFVIGYTIFIRDDPVPYPQKNGQGQNYPPNIGQTITLPGGTVGQDHVVVAAEFTDGSSQIVLDTYI